MLEEGLSVEICYFSGLSGGSTILHLIAHLGGTRESLIAPVLEKCPALLNRANWAQEIPATIAPAMMRTALQPRALVAFEAMAAVPPGTGTEALKTLAISELLYEKPTAEACDTAGETCVICMCEGEPEDPLISLRGCGHCFHRGDCLGGWRAEGTNGSSCPVCRAPLPEPTARAEAGGPNLLELAALEDDVDSSKLLLAAGAGGKAKAGSVEITPLMWAHWRQASGVVTLLTAHGAQLSNGDLEGLQRLRDVEQKSRSALERTTSGGSGASALGANIGSSGSGERGVAAGGSGAEAAKAADAEKAEEAALEEDKSESSDPELLSLLEVRPSLVWAGLGRCTHKDAVRNFARRMATSARPLAISGHERLARVEEPKPSALQFLAAARAALEGPTGAGGAIVAAADASPAAVQGSAAGHSHAADFPGSGRGGNGDGPTDAALEGAKLFSLRRLAEGKATSLPSAMALRLLLSDASADGLRERCGDVLSALCSSAPLGADAEAIVPFLAQLELALESLPSQRGTQFVGLNVPTPSNTLCEALNGEAGVGSFHPGGLIYWRGCGSVTSDPMLAKEAAIKGKGVALVLKIRSTSSRDVSSFSPTPDLGERLFPPRRCFRVAGLFALGDMTLRRGLATGGGVPLLLEAFETPDLGSGGSGAPLAWEDACGRREVCVVLDEEQASAGGLPT